MDNYTVKGQEYYCTLAEAIALAQAYSNILDTVIYVYLNHKKVAEAEPKRLC